MSFLSACPNCRKQLTLPDEQAGRPMTCRNCGEPNFVPLPIRPVNVKRHLPKAVVFGVFLCILAFLLVLILEYRENVWITLGARPAR